MTILDKIAYKNAKKICAEQCIICGYKDMEEFEALCERFGGMRNPVVCAFKQEDAYWIFDRYLSEFIEREERGEQYPFWPYKRGWTYICAQILSLWHYARFLRKMAKKEASEIIWVNQKG